MIELPDVPDTNPAASAVEVAAPAPAADNPGGTPAVATEASTPSPSTPATPEAEPKFEIKVDGKTELLTRAEMTALAQQGKSYTQKTQKLADEQRRWEADRAAILKAEKDNWKREQEAEAAKALADAGKDPAAKALERVEALEQNLEDQRLDGALSSLKAKYPDLDEQQFLIEASKQGLRSSADVANRGEAIAQALSESQNGRFETRFKEALTKGEHPELKALLAKHLADYLKNKGGGPSPVPAGALTPALNAPPKRVARTFDEAADIAHEMLTGEAPRP